MKYTVTKLMVLKEKKDSHIVQFNKLRRKIEEVCTHPKSKLVTKDNYYTDTLGNNGKNYPYAICTICDFIVTGGDFT